MIINFSPVRGDVQPTVSVSGDVLTINGATLDLSGIPEGAKLPAEAIASDWIAEETFLTRTSGVLSVTLVSPHGANAPEETRFPEPITVTSGVVVFPAYDVEEAE